MGAVRTTPGRLVSRDVTMTQDERRPILCLVTDRSRLGPTAGGGCGRLLKVVDMAGKAGVDLVQIRESDLSDRVLVELVGWAVEATRNTRTRIIVNDRVDVALAAGAAGVHLKSVSLSAERIRRVAPADWVIGRSVHGLDDALQATSAGALDYVIFGTVFQTASKPGVRAAGLEVLSRIVEALAVPVLAIGGVTAERVREVARSGAAGLAGIGAFVSAGQSIETLRALVVRMRETFGEDDASRHD